MRRRDLTSRPGQPAMLTDVTRVDTPKMTQPEPSPLARQRQPSLKDLLREAMQKALEAEDNVRRRRAVVREELRETFYRKRQTLPISFDLMVDMNCGQDGEIGFQIGQNQWQIQRAIMFGTALIAEQNARIIKLLEEDHDARHTRND